MNLILIEKRPIMFETLANRLDRTLKTLRGLGRITDKNIKDSLREIRVSLLEADVALPVIKEFMVRVQEEATGQKILSSLTPGQEFIKIVKSEITHALGADNEEINLNANPPVVILMAGLQGSGKTTTTAKLAKWLKTEKKKSVMVTSCDVYRPAAIKQLATLAADHDIEYFPSTEHDKPVKIAKKAIAAAKDAVCDVLIVDTAGRLHIDENMMDEIKDIHKTIKPTETFFVVDAMTGQDVANTAKAFNDALDLTGVILSKTDGDARGGAALSIRHITGKPIKFMGAGEKIDALEPFHPERVASRILGMGDVMTLIEDAEKLDKNKGKKLVKKIQKGGGFDLEDFRDQLKQVAKLGGIASIMKKLPGMGAMGQMAGGDVEGKIKEIEAAINSMTPKERHFPSLIKGSRKQRIAKGSGTSVPAINRILKQFEQMQKMVKKMSQKGGMKKMMRNMGGMPGMGSMPGGGQMPDMGQLGDMLGGGGLDGLPMDKLLGDLNKDK
jgi:signal recognition particle subunit SRP54